MKSTDHSGWCTSREKTRIGTVSKKDILGFSPLFTTECVLLNQRFPTNGPRNILTCYNFSVFNKTVSWNYYDFLLISLLSSLKLILSYLKSKLKFPINSKLHLSIKICFFLISQFFQCRFIVIFHSGSH